MRFAQKENCVVYTLALINVLNTKLLAMGVIFRKKTMGVIPYYILVG